MFQMQKEKAEVVNEKEGDVEERKKEKEKGKKMYQIA